MPLAPGLLERFLPEAEEHRIFVETGTHRGDGVGCALRAGFVAVYSCDVSEFAFGWACHRFKGRRDRAHLFLMDSRDFLRGVTVHLRRPAVFWLDAHWCGGNGEVGGRDGGAQADHPLLEELDIIGEHPIKRHTLLIDDRRLMGVEAGWPTEQQVRDRVRQINPLYLFETADSDEFSDDVLIARVPVP